jgi:hypothetical protein
MYAPSFFGPWIVILSCLICSNPSQPYVSLRETLGRLSLGCFPQLCEPLRQRMVYH